MILLFFSSISVITACQKLPRLQFFESVAQDFNGAPKKNISWQWSQVEFCFTKSRITKKKLSLFLLTISQEEVVSKPISYYYFDLEPLTVFNSAQWNQCLDHQKRLYSSRKQQDLSWLLDASIIGYRVLILHITYN